MFFSQRGFHHVDLGNAVTQLRAELVLTEWPRPEESLAALAVAAGGR